MRWFLFVALLSGCDVLWSIDHVTPIDAPLCAVDDEDCDQQPNATDLCPLDVDKPGDDIDMDGVGNTCDPDPSQVGNHVRMFDPFTDNARGWVQSGGAWTLGDGTFRTNVVGDARLELTVSPNVSMPSVAAIIDNVEIIDNGKVGLYGAGGSSELHCWISRSMTGEQYVMIEAIALFMQAPLPGSGVLRIQGGQLLDGRPYCRAHFGNDFDVQVTSGSIGGTAIDRFGLITSSGSGAYRSVMLMEVP